MGVRVTSCRLVRAPTPRSIIFNIFFVVVSCTVMSSSSGAAADSDAVEALLRFKNSISNSQSLNNWNPGMAPPCDRNKANWVGVLCFNGKVRGLQLENMGLRGVADVDLLISLPNFRTLSFMNNTLEGPIPDLKRLSRLRSVYLSYNHFSGKIPDDVFSGMRFLKKVLLSNNEFQGKIPSSLVSLPRLTVLRLDGNKFDGQIPDFGDQTSLKRINVSNNELEGPIPESLSKMDSTSFSGNKNLCGPPLESCSLYATNNNIILINNNNNTPGKQQPQLLKVVLIVLIIVLIVAVLAAAFIIANSKQRTTRSVRLGRPSSSTTTNDHHYHQSTYTRASSHVSSLPEPKLAAAATDANANQPKREAAAEGKLSFLRDDRRRFELHDLLRASAEILGSGTFGASYKATIQRDAMVVKRYKQMNSLGREDFHEHMRRLGGLANPNLLPLVAFYYRKEEKLLVYDFVENGSLANHLHGNHNGESALDWPTRLRIIKGIGKGLTYLYRALPSLVVPHGHLKSSNVVLSNAFEPLLTDYGLLPAIKLDHAEHLMMAYKSPEYAKMRRITKKTDVWSLGILILEILTGKFPENYLTHQHDPAADLAGWVNEMIKEKRTSEVFDKDMGLEHLKNSKAELLKLLKIGLSCCEEDLERRLDLNEAVEKIDEFTNIHHHDHDHHDYDHGDHHQYSPNVILNHRNEDQEGKAM